MDSSLSFPHLLLLRFKTAIKGFIDFIRSLKFYKNPEFRKADLALLGAYFGANPYKLSRKFLQSKGEKIIYAYGETPLTTLEKITNICGLTKDDTIFELGCGRGRTCFWLAHILRAKVIGIDFVPTFIEKANAVNQAQNLQFLCEDFLKSDLSKATVVYLHGSCMPDEDIEKLNRKLIRLRKGLKVITVSFSMSDYDSADHWEEQKVFVADFSWGSTEVYFQILK